MIDHAVLRARLVSPGDLSATDLLALQRHLDDCLDCRQLARVYEENRARLQTLRAVRPPAELRRSILLAADTAQDTAAAYLPALAVFLPITVLLGAACAAAFFGPLGLLAVFTVFAGLIGLIAWREQSRLPVEAALNPDRGSWIGPLLRGVGADIAGVIAGSLVFLLLVLILGLFGGQS